VAEEGSCRRPNSGSHMSEGSDTRPSTAAPVLHEVPRMMRLLDQLTHGVEMVNPRTRVAYRDPTTGQALRRALTAAELSRRASAFVKVAEVERACVARTDPKRRGLHLDGWAVTPPSRPNPGAQPPGGGRAARGPGLGTISGVERRARAAGGGCPLCETTRPAARAAVGGPGRTRTGTSSRARPIGGLVSGGRTP